MNQINVPKRYKSEMRDTRSREYKVALIKDYVKSHDKKVITIQDFVDVAGSTAQKYISDLRKSGRLIRYSIKTGRKTATYGYRWIDEDHVEITRAGEVHVKQIGYEDWPLGDEHTHIMLTNFIDNEIEMKLDDLDALEIKGMLRVRKSMRSEYARVDQQRKDALNAFRKGGDGEHE